MPQLCEGARFWVSPAKEASFGRSKSVWPMIASGTARPVVHAYVPVTEAAAAHRLLDAPGTVGKVILTMN